MTVTIGYSWNEGKDEICSWIRSRFGQDAVILDVGPGGGTWKKLLPEYTMDAVEIFPETAMEIAGLYRGVMCADIADVNYEWYDLVIFGDVIEHMTVEKAQAVLEYAKSHCRDCIVAVPWELEQGPMYGNQWEEHIQDDLTPELFDERYPGFEPLHLSDRYGYYHRRT